jgi:hypothetical protein
MATDILFNEDGSDGPVSTAEIHRELLLAGKHGSLTERAMQLLEGTTTQLLCVRDIAPRRAEWSKEGDNTWATREFEFDGRMYCWVAEGPKRVPGMAVRPREVLEPLKQKEDEEEAKAPAHGRTALAKGPSRMQTALYGPYRGLAPSEPCRMTIALLLYGTTTPGHAAAASACSYCGRPVAVHLPGAEPSAP